MTLEDRWHRLVSGEARGPRATLGRATLSASSGLYRFGLAANLRLYESGLKRRTQPALPVISVGNITLGGTGKSTAVRYLARALQQRGLTVGIVLRGHRRSGKGVVLAADGSGQRLPLDETGDEAAEVARALPNALVAVGKRREVAIELLAEHGAQIALLDDGFQYFRMARALDIVLLSAHMDVARARLFPRGVLREPWEHLRRADQVWITHADQGEPQRVEALQALAARFAPDKPVALARHEPSELLTLQGETLPLSALAGQSVVAVSGLGCPDSFEYTVRQLGAQVVAVRYPDHHQYTAADWRRMRRIIAVSNAAVVVTTEKDAVKLPADFPLPTWVLRSELRLISGEQAVSAALDRIAEGISA